MRTRSSPVSQPSDSVPTRKASLIGSSSGAGRRHARRARPCPRRRAPRARPAARRGAGDGRDLDLLERDGHDPRALAGLQEEGAVARLADRAGDEPVGAVEEVAASGHRILRVGVGSAGRGRGGEAYRNWGSGDLDGDLRGGRARRRGPGWCAPSVWTSPLPSVARTRSVWSPERRLPGPLPLDPRLRADGGRERGLLPRSPSSTRTSTFAIPRSGAHATPATATGPGAARRSGAACRSATG